MATQAQRKFEAELIYTRAELRSLTRTAYYSTREDGGATVSLIAHMDRPDYFPVYPYYRPRVWTV